MNGSFSVPRFVLQEFEMGLMTWTELLECLRECERLAPKPEPKPAPAIEVVGAVPSEISA